MTALEIMAEMDIIIQAAKKETNPCYGSFSMFAENCNHCADSEACAAVTAVHMKEIEAEIIAAEEAVEFDGSAAEAQLADIEVEAMKEAEAATAATEDQELLAKLMKGVRAANREVMEEAYIAVLTRRPEAWDDWRSVLDKFSGGKKKYDFTCKFLLKLRKLKMIEWSGWANDDVTWNV